MRKISLNYPQYPLLSGAVHWNRKVNDAIHTIVFCVNQTTIIIVSHTIVIFSAMTAPDIQEMLGHAVNGLIKHFYKPEKEVGR